MSFQKVFICLLLTVAFTTTVASYNECLAYDLAQVSTVSFYTNDVLQNLSCGDKCDYLKHNSWQYFFHGEYPVDSDTTVSFSVFTNPRLSQVVVAFRGTVGDVQLQQEFDMNYGAKYNLQPVKTNVLTYAYFYTKYRDILRTPVREQIELAKQAFPGYNFLFTGHSLGGALTTLAIVDAIKENLVDGETTKIYSFGSPRVGNSAFAKLFSETVGESYRLVHHKDIVPHIPECIIDSASNRCNNSEEGEEGGIWYPWHVDSEVFYDNDLMPFGSQVICQGEDPNCANKYTKDESNWSDHSYYFGWEPSCLATALPKKETVFEKVWKFMRKV